MIAEAIYFAALSLTVLATLNFVWMAAGPGPKQNVFKWVQEKLHLSRSVMNAVYIFIGFAALLTVVMSVSYVKKAEEGCSVV